MIETAEIEGSDFQLYCATLGLSSFSYLLIGVINSYQESDLVKLDIVLNGQSVDAMATIVHKLKAQRIGRELVEKLKKFIDRYLI